MFVLAVNGHADGETTTNGESRTDVSIHYIPLRAGPEDVGGGPL